MIKKRTRPNVRVREVSPDPPPTTTQSTSEPNTFFEPGAEDSLTTQEEEDKLSYVSLLPHSCFGLYGLRGEGALG